MNCSALSSGSGVSSSNGSIPPPLNEHHLYPSLLVEALEERERYGQSQDQFFPDAEDISDPHEALTP
jgi:hypothetical protein